MTRQDDLLRASLAALVLAASAAMAGGCSNDPEGDDPTADVVADTGDDAAADVADDTVDPGDATDDTGDDAPTDTAADTGSSDTPSDADTGTTDAPADADAADTADAIDTADGSGDTTDGSGEGPEPVDVTFRFTDFVTASPLAGLTASFDGTDVTTDSGGLATFAMEPGAPFHVTVGGTGCRPHDLYAWAPDAVATLNYSLATDFTITSLETALEGNVDDADGLLSVSVKNAETLGRVPGVTVTLDAAYDVALAFDSTSELGLSNGNVTLPDSSSTIIFVNVTAGAVTPSFDMAIDTWENCDIGPGTLDVAAGHYVIAEYRCTFATGT